MDIRFKELDSLRGLASISVLFGHFLNIYPIIYNSTYSSQNGWVINLVKFTPFHILWAGHEAVIFFFVLSGFVLSLPFFCLENNVSYTQFIIKRICRIYIPYLFSIISAIIMNLFFYKGGINELSTWFNNVWQSPIDFRLVVKHLLFIISYDNSKFNPALWSLVHEMRISLIFPLIMYFIIKYNWKINLSIGLLLTPISIFLNYLSIHYLKYSSDYFNTFSYIGMFIVGALLAKYRQVLTYKFKGLTKQIKLVCIVITILVYTHLWWFHITGILNIKLFKKIYGISSFTDWITLLGVSAFIIIALSFNTVSKLLLNKYIYFIGKISYSLYLYHSICLIVSVYILYNIIPTWIILFIALSFTLIISTMGYYFIEIPSIRLGKYLSRKNIRAKLHFDIIIGK